jgi:predicted subunit of tRNA(5-methylaminomethyl-2-thiouridylate) methyltransferase
MAYDRNKALRNVVKNLHKRAGDKVSRNKRLKGVNIAGTANDPRVPGVQINKMNARELREYSAKVQGFLSRDVQFLKGASGRAIATY